MTPLVTRVKVLPSPKLVPSDQFKPTDKPNRLSVFVSGENFFHQKGSYCFIYSCFILFRAIFG